MGWGIGLYDLVKIPVKKPCNIYYLRWWYNGWHYWAFLPGSMVVSTEGEKYRTIGTKKISMSSGQVNRDQVKGIRTLMFTREVSLLTIAGWMNIRIERDTIQVYDNQINGGEIEFVAIVGSKEISYATGYSPVPVVPVVPANNTYCEIIVGTQIWMCKNWDANYPGSKVYDDDEANRSEYGGLYTWDQIMNPGFAPLGWHVPTITEWNTLISYLGGNAVAGGHLKEIGFTHWDAPNTGADNSSGFAALGGGFNYAGLFQGLGLTANFWVGPVYGGGSYVQLKNSDATVLHSFINQSAFLSIRLMKDVSALTGVVYDVDGNMYHYITIGTQQWILENFKSTKYADGIAIPNLTVNADWTAEDGTPGHNGALCYYNNDVANKAIYGTLYNWHVISNAHGIAIPGWRVPTTNDYVNLLINTGVPEALMGGYMKEIGFTHWNAPNTGAIDAKGFALRGGGGRSWGGAFSGLGLNTRIWNNTTATLNPPYMGETVEFQNTWAVGMYNIAKFKNEGCYIKLMKDV